MNIAELIELLQRHPPTMRVVVPGWQGGLCDILEENVEQSPIKLDQNKDTFYCGPHETTDSDESPDEVAVVIWRTD